MQKFILVDVSELCDKCDAQGKEVDSKLGIDLLNDKISEGTIIEGFCFVPSYQKILVLINTK
jgi:hypothetical protein